MSAASVQGRGALATESQPPVARVGRRGEVRPLFVPGSPCCDCDRRSLFAHVLVAAGQRERLEHFCRDPLRNDAKAPGVRVVAA